MKIAIIFLLFAASIAQSAEPEIKGTPSELARYLPGMARIVSVTGEGEVKVPADTAIMSFNVSTENKSLAEALRLNEDIRSQIGSFLKARGINPDRMRSSKFSSTAKHGTFSDKVKSQRVDNLIKITTRDEKEFQAVAALPDKFAEVIYRGTEFEHSEKDALKAKAVTQACADAEQRKQVFEKALSLKLSPKSFSELVLGPGRQTGAQGGTDPNILGKFGDEPARATTYSSLAYTAETVSAFGEMAFKVRVTIEYAAEAGAKF
jgi:uncharacterized protein YggE